MKNNRVALLTFVTILAFLVISGGCSRFGVYRIDVQQGNVLTQEMIDQLKPGMTKAQVNYVLGTPLLIDTFSQDRWDYVYSQQPGGEERVQQRLSVFFKKDQLTHFQGDFKPQITD